MIDILELQKRTYQTLLEVTVNKNHTIGESLYDTISEALSSLQELEALLTLTSAKEAIKATIHNTSFEGHQSTDHLDSKTKSSVVNHLYVLSLELLTAAYALNLNSEFPISAEQAFDAFNNASEEIKKEGLKRKTRHSQSRQARKSDQS